MHELYELKEKLCEELEEYGRKGELSTGSLEVIDKLAHTVKNLDKIIEAYEDDEYSSRGGSYDDGMGGSYARGGRGRGGYRDSNQYGSYARGGRGNYATDGGMIEDLRALMQEAPDDRTRQEFEKFIRKMESM